MEVIFRNLPRGTEENNEKPQDDVQIRTEDLSNTSQEAYRYSNLLGRLYIIFLINKLAVSTT
jgi:hypothetical protein